MSLQVHRSTCLPPCLGRSSVLATRSPFDAVSGAPARLHQTSLVCNAAETRLLQPRTGTLTTAPSKTGNPASSIVIPAPPCVKIVTSDTVWYYICRSVNA
ncbi:hypothetical protein M3J09_001065 [Ascochyta lentis]